MVSLNKPVQFLHHVEATAVDFPLSSGHPRLSAQAYLCTTDRKTYSEETLGPYSSIHLDNVCIFDNISKSRLKVLKQP